MKAEQLTARDEKMEAMRVKKQMSVVSIYDTRLKIENPYKGNFWTYEESVKMDFGIYLEQQWIF